MKLATPPVLLLVSALCVLPQGVVRAQEPKPNPPSVLTISTLTWPMFNPIALCGQTLSFPANTVGTFTIFVTLEPIASGELVTLEAAGVPVGAVFSPPLPLTSVNPASMLMWTPPAAGMMETITLTATAASGLQANCSIPIITTTGTGQECLLLIGGAPTSLEIAPGDWLLTEVLVAVPFVGSLPSLPLPSHPAFNGFPLYLQVALFSPEKRPTDPYVLSNGLEVILGVEALPYGPADDIQLWLDTPPTLGTTVQPSFNISPAIVQPTP